MLYLRELKKVMFSFSYILFVIIAVFALFSQGVLDFADNIISEPVAGGNYGAKREEIPEVIMPAALQSLYIEFQENNYKCYPVGFLKNVKLNDEEQMRIAEIIADITGMDVDEIYRTQGAVRSNGNDVFFGVSDNKNLSYAAFQERMQEVDDILGGGSSYAKEALIGFGTVSVSYEDACTAYGLATGQDQITGGYARLFSDYAVAMVFAIFPVFLAVIISMKDHHAKMSELIYTRKAPGIRIVGMRYLAVLTAVMIPAVILSYVSNAAVWGMYQGMELDYFAPLKYDFGWIMPTAMMSIAVGMFFTELTNTPIAIAVQGIWWFIDLNVGMRSVSAAYSLMRLAPRHNADSSSYFRTQDFIDNFSNLVCNRLLFTAFSILLVAAAAVAFEAKRKGKINGNHEIKRIFAGIKNRRD